MKKELVHTTKIIILGGILALSASLVFADWTSPPANPPSNNVDAPINVGTSPQTKMGRLFINSSVNTGFIVAGGAQPLQIIDNTPGDDLNKVLTSDANGYASWQDFGSISNPHGFVSLSVGPGNWDPPAGVSTIEVHVIGGGGGGWWEGGAGGGYAYKVMSVTHGIPIAYTVADGGRGTGPYVGATNSCTNPTALKGGDSIFGTVIAYGGDPGFSGNGGSTRGGGFGGADWGAYGKDLNTVAYQPRPYDKTSGWASGFPYSSGDVMLGGSNNTVPTVAAYNGGGGFGDSDAGGGLCGGKGAAGAIFIKY